VLAILLLLAASPALAAPLPGHVERLSPHARYEVWVATDLDLTAPDQPAASAAVGPDGRFSIEPEGFDPSQPHWLFLHQRFQPEQGPPLDLYLPDSLHPRTAWDTAPVTFRAVEPEQLLQPDRFSSEPRVLAKVGLVSLLVLGFGLLLRWRLGGAPAGPDSAPLAGRGPPSVEAWEQRCVVAVLALAGALRLPGFGSQSLDLLEASYLPGIGDAESATLGGGVAQLLRSLAAMDYLDLTHPPLWHAVLGVMALGGPTEAALRAPALIASLATVIGLWRLGRWFDRPTGLLAAGLFAVSPPAVYFGQDATPYSFIGAVAVLALLAMLGALRTGQRHLWWICLGLLITGFFAHYNVALLGIGFVGLLAVFAWTGRSDPRWPAAVRAATTPALVLAPVPLFWLWPHFSTFEPVAQHTRLVADAYPRDPGALAFGWDFARVIGGLTVDAGPVVALAMVAAVGMGLRRGLSDRDAPRALGVALLTLLIALVASVAFFYGQVRAHLDGRVFYGFRWVGWFLPLAFVIGAAGLRAGGRRLGGALGLLWFIGLLEGLIPQMATAPRPDYRGAAQQIHDELADRDGVTTLPTWFQRGNVELYALQQAGTRERDASQGQSLWILDGKRVSFAATHPQLPFEASVRNGHLDRVWVAVVDERMSGRAKFDGAIGAQALAWADEHLIVDGQWSFDRIDLRRYRVPTAALHAPAGTVISSDDAVTYARSYSSIPRRTGNRAFRDASAVPAGKGVGPTSRWQAPLNPPCVDWEFGNLDPALDPSAPLHWLLELQIPVDAGRGLPTLTPLGPAEVRSELRDGRLWARIVGGPCHGPPLRVRVDAPQ